MSIGKRAALYGALLALIGVLMSQYVPLFSDPLTQNLCQPFSPCRYSALPAYLLGGLILGVLLGYVSGLVQDRAK